MSRHYGVIIYPSVIHGKVAGVGAREKGIREGRENPQGHSTHHDMLWHRVFTFPPGKIALGLTADCSWGK